jgi:hypothetical protein
VRKILIIGVDPVSAMASALRQAAMGSEVVVEIQEGVHIPRGSNRVECIVLDDPAAVVASYPPFPKMIKFDEDLPTAQRIERNKWPVPRKKYPRRR